VFPEEFDKEAGEILYEEIESRIKTEAKLDLDIQNVEWFSTYKVHTRHVSRFSAGRSFLAGDSAHIHTPAGAQGMNTGIQDGYNLAWKLALVIRGIADERLLQTYNEERLENAKHLLKTTDRLFGFAAGTDWFMNFLRLNVLPPVAKHILSFEPIRKFLFPLISQTGITYRHSSLSDHAGDEDFEVKAGDRMPYFLLDGASIYDKLNQPTFHFIAFSTDSGFQAMKDELKGRFFEFVDFNAIPLSREVAGIFGASKDFIVLLRPDNHIAFISSDISSRRLQEYLSELAG